MTDGGARRAPLAEAVLRRFIGGVGLGAWLLHREAPAGVGPLAPESPLVFCFSPLVGMPLTTAAKFAVVAKSPLTFRLNDALSSSRFALAGKRTGAHALVIGGACAAPSVLVVEDGAVRLEAAGELWGLPTDEAAEALARRFGPEFHAAVIGPAGENRVRTVGAASRAVPAGRYTHPQRSLIGAVVPCLAPSAPMPSFPVLAPAARPARLRRAVALPRRGTLCYKPASRYFSSEAAAWTG